LPLNPFEQAGEGVPGLSPVSRLTIHVTVIGHGPACAGMLMLNVRVVLLGLLLPPPLQLPPGVAVSWTFVGSVILEEKVTLSVAVQAASLYVK